jgi:hypothetical protein
MNPERILHAANEIDRLTTALGWLRSNGHALSHRQKDSFSISVHLNSCSALPGAKEAQAQMSAIARLQIEEIVACAIKDAVNTIEIHRAAIAAEVAPEDMK